MFGNFFSENGAIYEIMWKNVVEPDMLQRTLQYDGAEKVQFACWITNGRRQSHTRNI